MNCSSSVAICSNYKRMVQLSAHLPKLILRSRPHLNADSLAFNQSLDSAHWHCLNKDLAFPLHYHASIHFNAVNTDY